MSTGYGYAGFNIVDSLIKLGHSVPFNSSKAPVMINFTMPHFYIINQNQYSIGYTPWESTKLQDGWATTMNFCDEIWTTSDLMAEWFKAEGVTQPLYVYEHGIASEWTPKFRKKSGPIKFLHVGEPAERKGGQLVVDAWMELFKNDPRVSLTIKANGFNTTRVQGDGWLLRPDQASNNVNLIIENVDLKDLIKLYHDHDVLLYPSWGEGFGLIPLQGIATGMPVIFNHKWAPYRRFANDLDIEDRLVPVLTDFEGIHPGMVFQPSKQSLKQHMLEIVDNFEDYSHDAFEIAPRVHEEYNWLRVTENAFKHIVERFS
jgi:glycosyltransferase involved in cell wall biosynthesis